MKIKAVVHEAEEVSNLIEAIEGCLPVDIAEPRHGGKERVVEIAL
ncbi:MAG TPA: hypothetical protein VKV32_14495 [Stellaceae bacterium]|nr:hypothetical protein [Stellaceae bacterium]